MTSPLTTSSPPTAPDIRSAQLQEARARRQAQRKDLFGERPSSFPLTCKRCGRSTADPDVQARHQNELWWWVTADLCLACATPQEIAASTNAWLDLLTRAQAARHKTIRTRRNDGTYRIEAQP